MGPSLSHEGRGEAAAGGVEASPHGSGFRDDALTRVSLAPARDER